MSNILCTVILGVFITLSLVGEPPNNGSVDCFRIFSVQHIIFLPILFRECDIQYNDTKIIEFGWKLLILWVIFCGRHFCNLKFSWLSCLKTVEIGQMQKMTVNKTSLLIKQKVSDQIEWFWGHDDRKRLFYPINESNSVK